MNKRAETRDLDNEDIVDADVVEISSDKEQSPDPVRLKTTNMASKRDKRDTGGPIAHRISGHS
jgi:hypothetical protein